MVLKHLGHSGAAKKTREAMVAGHLGLYRWRGCASGMCVTDRCAIPTDVTEQK